MTRTFINRTNNETIKFEVSSVSSNGTQYLIFGLDGRLVKRLNKDEYIMTLAN